jgi:IK cytokine
VAIFGQRPASNDIPAKTLKICYISNHLFFSGEGLAERRKQLIQESKYLGGDMEHTHLVKGLDYALLEKVRAEITSKEMVDVEVEEAIKQKEKDEEPEEQVEFRTKMARNIFRTIFKTKAPERNELFLPRRMAYVVDLEDDFGESDIPTTLIRSKADCPSLEVSFPLQCSPVGIVVFQCNAIGHQL